MSGEKELIPIENYYNLASAIVEVACADYVDAKIVSLYGYLSLKEYRKNIYKAYIEYGSKRYIIKSKEGIKRQKEKININKCRKLADLIDLEKQKELGKYEIKQLEMFFLSDYFDILMPNTDGTNLLRILNRRAKSRKRFKSSYLSQKGV